MKSIDALSELTQIAEFMSRMRVAREKSKKPWWLFLLGELRWLRYQIERAPKNPDAARDLRYAVQHGIMRSAEDAPFRILGAWPLAALGPAGRHRT